MKFFLLLLLVFPFSINAQDKSGKEVIAQVKQSIKNAQKSKSYLTTKELNIDAAPHALVKHLLNNLCSYPNTSYFEVGCEKGSAWIAALYGNQDKIIQAI